MPTVGPTIDITGFYFLLCFTVVVACFPLMVPRLAAAHICDWGLLCAVHVGLQAKLLEGCVLPAFLVAALLGPGVGPFSCFGAGVPL